MYPSPHFGVPKGKRPAIQSMVLPLERVAPVMRDYEPAGDCPPCDICQEEGTIGLSESTEKASTVARIHVQDAGTEDVSNTYTHQTGAPYTCRGNIATDVLAISTLCRLRFYVQGRALRRTQ